MARTIARITRQIAARTAVHVVEVKGSITLVLDGQDVVFVKADHDYAPGSGSVIRLETAEGTVVDLPWDYRDDKGLTQVVDTPVVGEGITMGVGSDSYSGTIWEVSPSGKTFVFTLDRHNYETGVREPVEPWSREEFPGFVQSNRETARWNVKRGGFYSGRSHVTVGVRRDYRDPSF